MNAKTVVMPLQDMMVNKMILETLLTKGKVTIEEAYFMNELIENVITKVFESEIKQIEETLNTSTQQQTIEENSKTNQEKAELDESTMINLFLKK